LACLCVSTRSGAGVGPPSDARASFGFAVVAAVLAIACLLGPEWQQDRWTLPSRSCAGAILCQGARACARRERARGGGRTEQQQFAFERKPVSFDGDRGGGTHRVALTPGGHRLAIARANGFRWCCYYSSAHLARHVRLAHASTACASGACFAGRTRPSSSSHCCAMYHIKPFVFYRCAVHHGPMHAKQHFVLPHIHLRTKQPIAVD
jgi:hypothetical protein